MFRGLLLATLLLVGLAVFCDARPHGKKGKGGRGGHRSWTNCTTVDDCASLPGFSDKFICAEKPGCDRRDSSEETTDEPPRLYCIMVNTIMYIYNIYK